MNPKTLQDTLRTLWVLPASGLASANVYFARQETPGPAPSPRIVIDLGDLDRVGMLDAVARDFDAARPAGQEIRYTAHGPRELSVMLEAFSSKADGTEQGSDARALLSQCDAQLALPTIRQALNAAGLGVLRQGNVRWMPGIVRAGWEGRAQLETVFCVSETAQATIGYIQSVSGTQTVDGNSTSYTYVIED